VTKIENNNKYLVNPERKNTVGGNTIIVWVNY